jgi:hypothetical protein
MNQLRRRFQEFVPGAQGFQNDSPVVRAANETVWEQFETV